MVSRSATVDELSPLDGGRASSRGSPAGGAVERADQARGRDLILVVIDRLQLAFPAIPKNASSALRHAFGLVGGRHAADIPDGYTIVACVRHPFDRLVSALYSVLRSGAPLDERIEQYTSVRPIDSHIRPQAEQLPPIIDIKLRFEDLADDWERLRACYPLLPPLERINPGKYRPVNWRDARIDWERWRPLYAGDFALAREWGCSG